MTKGFWELLSRSQTGNSELQERQSGEFFEFPFIALISQTTHQRVLQSRIANIQTRKQRMPTFFSQRQEKKSNRDLVGSPKPRSTTRAVAGGWSVCSSIFKAQMSWLNPHSNLGPWWLVTPALSSSSSGKAQANNLYTPSVSPLSAQRHKEIQMQLLPSPTIEDGTEIPGGPGNELPPL